jgi:hypothetical protein
MGLEFQDMLDLLGGSAADDVACQSCASNPNVSVVTHRANQPIAAKDIQPRPRDLKPWLSSAIRSDGKRISIVKNAHGTTTTSILNLALLRN